jgi:hypothetical protein
MRTLRCLGTVIAKLMLVQAGLVEYHPAAWADDQGRILDVIGGEVVVSVLLLDMVEKVTEVHVADHAPT